jgi:hypothetical protein
MVIVLCILAILVWVAMLAISLYKPGLIELIFTIVFGQKEYLDRDIKDSEICNKKDIYVSDSRKNPGN